MKKSQNTKSQLITPESIIMLICKATEVTTMFEGNSNCTLCKSDLPEKERNFGVSLSGYTYVFCNDCMKFKKDEIVELLHSK